MSEQLAPYDMSSLVSLEEQTLSVTVLSYLILNHFQYSIFFLFVQNFSSTGSIFHYLHSCSEMSSFVFGCKAKDERSIATISHAIAHKAHAKL